MMTEELRNDQLAQQKQMTYEQVGKHPPRFRAACELVWGGCYDYPGDFWLTDG